MTHDYVKRRTGAGMHCRHCLKAYWRQSEPCELDSDEIERRKDISATVLPIEEEQRLLDPHDPEVKKQRIAAHLERTGLADRKMRGDRAKALLQQLSDEYDEDPTRFLPVGVN